MRVWVTRDETPDGPLCVALHGLGLVAVLEPVVQRRVLTDAADELGQLGSDDWLVLTSVFAIEHVNRELACVPLVAVVGDASRRAAEALGLRVALTAPGGDRGSLVAELQRHVRRGTVCHPRSSEAEPIEPWEGVRLVSPVLYETVPRWFDPQVFDRVDVIAVTSPSAVRVIGTQRHPFASIGPSTSAALRRIGVAPWVEARRRTFEALAEAIAARTGGGRT